MLTKKPVTLTATDRVRAVVAPRWSLARTRIQDDVAPAVTDAIRNAKESSAPLRAEALDRATIAYHALRGEPPKARRWPLAIGFFAIGTGAGMIVAALSRRPQAEPPPVRRPSAVPDERAAHAEPAAAYAP